MTTFQPHRADDRLLQVEEAQALVLAALTPGPIESVALAEAAGRILREDVEAFADAPAADNSGMDGYAVRAVDIAAATADIPVVLEVVGDIPAGSLPQIPLEPGTAMRIMTGAFVPPGADAVVQVEWTDAGAEQVKVFRPVRQGANVRRRGEDMRRGQVVLRAGTRIGPAEIAMLAANHRARPAVGRRPVVAILSTGDELLEPGSPPVDGKIVNTNAPLLAALVREAGALPLVLPAVRDEREATIAALRAAFESDVVVTTGGVSVGAFDYVKDALDALGAETRFWRVAMKPGKPVVFSTLRDAVCFGLPGNPVSCFVAFHLFVAPALRAMLGASQLFPPVASARLTAALRGAADRRVYFRAQAAWRDGELTATPLAAQGSGSLTSMIGANALVIVEAGAEAAAESTQRVVLLA